MAHFAKIQNGMVTDVIVISNNILNNCDFPESEKLGINFIKNEIKLDGDWLQTSYNGNFRSLYAGIGMLYITEDDVFIHKEMIKENGKWVMPHPPIVEDIEDDLNEEMT